MSRKILHGAAALTNCTLLLGGVLLPASTALAADLGLGVNVSFSPAQVPVNTASTMTVTLQHNNNQAINNIAFNQPLGGLVAGAITGNTCGGTASVSGGNLVLAGSALPATTTLASCTITLPVQAPVAATYPVTFLAGQVTGTGADSTPAATAQESSATLTVANYIPISGEIKYFSQAYGGAQTNIIRGLDTVTYELTLNNQNAQTLSNVRVPISMSGVVEAAGGIASNTCGGSFATAPATGAFGPFVLSGASIPASGSCTIRFPVRLRNSTVCTGAGSQSGGWNFGLNAITSQPAAGSQQIQGLPWHAAGICVGKGAQPATVGSGDLATNPNKSFQIQVYNFNVEAANISLTDLMPSIGGNTAGVIAKSVALYGPGSHAACTSDPVATRVDTGTNTAYIAGQVPAALNHTAAGAPGNTTACTWRVLYDAWNDGVSPNTSGVDPIVRTNSIPAGSAISVPSGTAMPFPTAKADVTINPPVGDLGVSKSFTSIAGMSNIAPGTVQLNIRLTNYSQVDALVIDTLRDDLSTMMAVYAGPADGYTFIPGSMSFTNCGANPQATLEAGSNGYTNTRLTVTPQSITIPRATNSQGQTCTVSARVYASASMSWAWRTNTIPAKTVKAHYASLPLSEVVNTAPATADHNATPAIRLDKSFTAPLRSLNGVPAVMAGMPGSTATLTVTVTGQNVNLVQLSHVQFVDRFPAVGSNTPWAMKLTSNTTTSNTGTCGGTITPDADSGGFKFSGGMLPAGNGTVAPSCTVLVPVVAPAGAAGVVQNRLSGPQSAQDLAAPNDVQSITSVVLGTQYADLAAIDGQPAFAKSFSKTQLNVGEETTLKIELVNSGQTLFALNGVSYADTLPVGMVFKPNAVPQLSGDATCIAGTATINGNTLNVSFAGTLNIIKTACTVTIPVIARAAGNLINTIPSGALKSTEGITNPQLAEATVTAIGSADLFTQKTHNAPDAGLKAGDVVVYQLVVGNLGPDAAAGALVTDTPPAGLTVTGWTCAPATPGADSCPASGAGSPVNVPVTLISGSGVLFTINATINELAAASLTNTATVTAPPSVTDPHKSNNTSTSTVELMVDMAAAWNHVPTAFGPGSVITGLTLTCENVGATAAFGAICTPQVTAGTISNLSCQLRSTSAAVILPATVGKGDAVACTMDYKAPGTPGGSSATETGVTFTGTTGAARDSNPANDQDTASADIIDAVDDALGPIPAAGGDTPSVLGNDRLGIHAATPENVTVKAYGAASCTPAVPGATCSTLTVNGDGTVTVPPKATAGYYHVPYQICVNPAAAPPACDTAVASVTVEKPQPTAIAPVPALDRWVLTLLGLMLAAGAMTGLRKRSH